jgi:hypothetical protein
MKLRILMALAAGILLLTLAAPHVATQDPGCSNASIQGAFGFSETGSKIDALFQYEPRALVGTFRADGHGNLTGSLTKSATGIITEVTLTGTYAVNSACTGSVTTTDSDGEVRHANLVVLMEHEIRWIQTDADKVKTGDAKPLAQ